ncbi:type III-B CRISPR module RAMP protein Cmr4 [Candidatus Kryptobacter tengchongensis]|uniref:CRISPR-associated protein Cmr4 n=1 Tax=Kryptobacter tengchongensis TaxID=1643429 RepID=A0A916PEN3_KRYT1|nr:type III-B CRISPR module RAMP protein Cmr4 [Candidatus Kryptobacter tengchongensis]CUT01629.1 CRISPR-associated protein Cmr4 [Candidatus Kryptobacter tengchongensis]
MFEEKRVLFLIAETPVHAGSGSEVGIVDLPIQRERYTDFPKIESSGLKGCIREAFESSNSAIQINNNTIRPKDKIRYRVDGKDKETDYISLVFGPEGEEAHAGAMSITDARILLFPVKSLKGVFAWITCPMVLERFKKEIEFVGIQGFSFSNFKNLENTLPKQSNIAISSKIVLEEFTFEVREDEITSKIAEWLANAVFHNDNTYDFWREKLKKDLVILSDGDFTQFVKTSTEIITRTKIDNKTGTVASGALWTEEYLPQDTILYSLVMFTFPRVENDARKGVFKANTPQEEAKFVSEFFEKGLPSVIQIGGNQTIGKGFVRVNILK